MKWRLRGPVWNMVLNSPVSGRRRSQGQPLSRGGHMRNRRRQQTWEVGLPEAVSPTTVDGWSGYEIGEGVAMRATLKFPRVDDGEARDGCNYGLRGVYNPVLAKGRAWKGTSMCCSSQWGEETNTQGQKAVANSFAHPLLYPFDIQLEKLHANACCPTATRNQIWLPTTAPLKARAAL